MSEEDLAFVSEDDDRGELSQTVKRWRILLVDDDEDVHLATYLTLKDAVILGRQLEFLYARSAAEARALLLNEADIAVAFVDVVMETKDAGLLLSKFIREEAGILDTRIILRTGQPGYAPEHTVICDYDINDYKTKSELTSNKLYTTVTAAVRSYSQICIINANRRGLAMIVRASAALMMIMDINEFATNVIEHLAVLLRLPPNGLICFSRTAANGSIQFAATMGRFAQYRDQTLDALGDPAIANLIELSASQRQNQYLAGGTTLFVGSSLGRSMVAFIETPEPLDENDRQLAEVFCANVSVCLDNAALVARLHDHAYFDPLSRLPNRANFIEKIEEAFCSANFPSLTLAIIDIDHFSEANDAFGHNYGDHLLRAIAARLGAAVGPDVVLARVSGDAFALLGSDMIVTPTLLAGLFRSDFVINGNEHAVSATFGLARLSEVDSATDAMQDASIALKRAKLEHRGHFCYYTRNMGGDVRTRVNMTQQLHRALGTGSLFLLYQPQINLESGQTVGAEALLRWRTYDGHLVPPTQFIPLAEDSGLIVVIGDWVFREACRQLSTLIGKGFVNFRMAVNVSAVQLRHPEFINMIERVILETGVNPANIEMEITESVAMLDPEYVVSLLERVKGLCFTLAIDDFGTGFSSLAYLQRFPVDRLKIDQGFVSRITLDNDAKNIAEMIIDLGHNLGMEIIAEGVESALQADYLRSRGCHEAQGYLYAHPLDSAALLEWLTSPTLGRE